MITRKRVKSFNKVLTCLLCKGYLIEATTINTCMHSFCRSCIVKHVKLHENYFCPTCESEIRLSNLRPDLRLRSIIYKLIPGVYAKEEQKSSKLVDKHKSLANGSLNGKNDKQIEDQCSEDESLSKQYFYDQDEPISLSLEYHMESILGNSEGLGSNIPQVRYLQAPAAFKVLHLKKFLSSKYDLNNLKKSMNIDIIYEGEILHDSFSLMDIAYAYCWERVAPLKLFYRIYKSSKHTNNKLKLIERAVNRQPYVRLSSDLGNATDLTSKLSKNHEDDAGMRVHTTNKNEEAPRHDLKIIIAKKSSSKSVGNNNKIRLNKPNGNGSSKVLSDFERLRGDVDNFQHFSSASSAESFVSTSEMKTTLSKKTGTVSHHDLKLENKSSMKKQQQHSNSHDYYCESTTFSDKEKQQKRESAKHTKKEEKLKTSCLKSTLSPEIPKLKIELPSLKTKITVPKTPSDTYVIAKSPSSPLKKVHFDISSSTKSSTSSYDFNDDEAADINSVDQTEYAERIGLKPVERKVESIILHRKRKKSKHSKESEHSKRPKLHVSSSLDESLKLKLKIMGGKSCKSDKKSNEDEATCNLRAVPCKTADLTSTTTTTTINMASEPRQEEKQKNIRGEKQQKETSDEAVVELENYKYSVSEQKSTKSGSDMVFIPKLVLQKTQPSDKKESYVNATTTTEQQRRNSFVVEQSNPTSTDANERLKLKVKSPDAISSSNLANQKLMKPPTAKMGSPQQSQISTTFSLSPIRPHSIPASLKLSPISKSPPTPNEIQQQSLKRSLSLGAEKCTPSFLNTYTKQIKSQSPFPSEIQFSKIPPLIPTSNSIRNIYGSTNMKPQQNPSKLPNINVKDPTKLFPNACSSVEILKIPQKSFSSQNVNRPIPPTIPLEKIRKSAQSQINTQKVLPKSQHHLKMPTQSFPQSQSPQCSNSNYSGIYQSSPISNDISLDRYTYELTQDLAMLDRNLSLEKNFEHWEKRKLEEYSKLSDLKNFPMTVRPVLNQQQNLSVRNIPNPSALMMSRSNQTKMPQKESPTVTSTNSEHSDIEEILSKSTIAKSFDKSLNSTPSNTAATKVNVNDKKSIEKLTEYLRLTAAKSKDTNNDDDDNNNNSTNKCESSSIGRSYNLLAGNKSEKFMNVNLPSVDVICIDS